MNAVQLIGVAASLSLLAGWRLYATVAAAGLGMRLHLIPLPHQAAALSVLANPWIIGIAAFGALAELLADKVAWLDSLWDAVHLAIRPVGGALIALAVVDAHDPVWQAAALLLGGGAPLVSHSAKSGARAVVNTSPEPLSNIAVSGAEDLATGAGLWLTLAHPAVAAWIAGALLVFALVLLAASWRVVRSVGRWLLRGGET